MILVRDGSFAIGVNAVGDRPDASVEVSGSDAQRVAMEKPGKILPALTETGGEWCLKTTDVIVL